MKKIYKSLSLILSGLSSASLASAEALKDPLGGQNLTQILDSITTKVAEIIGPVAGIMFIVAGVFYLTSAGNPGRIETAKTCLIYAVVGTAIALSAGAISAAITSTIGA